MVRFKWKIERRTSGVCGAVSNLTFNTVVQEALLGLGIGGMLGVELRRKTRTRQTLEKRSIPQSTDKSEAPRRLCLSPKTQRMSLPYHRFEQVASQPNTKPVLKTPLFPGRTPVYDTANRALRTGAMRLMCCLYAC